MTQRTVVSVERKIGDRTLTIETGRIATQADSVICRYGDTMVLVAAVEGPPRTELDFFPLYVDYRENVGAAGKFPGGFFKREGRPTTKETMTARLMDRPHRPLFPDGYFGDVAIWGQVLSADQENDPDVLAMIGASAALHVSPTIPFQGPTGSVRVAKLDKEFVLFPTRAQTESSTLDLLVSGTKDAVCMIEACAWEIPEEEMVEAILFGHDACKMIAEMVDELRQKLGLPEKAIPPSKTIEDTDLFKSLRARFGDEVYQASKTLGKIARKQALEAATKRLVAALAPEVAAGKVDEKQMKEALTALERDAVRRQIVAERVRCDGRALDEVRPITCEVGYLPRTHGSAIFTRGETQALVTTTLGTSADEQKIDGLHEPYQKRFYLHYNFPAYSVRETWPNRGPKRREIGHGMLAERSIFPILPPYEKFPYTIRVTSDITESNGSSSMASVCGGTLSLMDAGVPLRQPVAGVAMGLIQNADEWIVLTDLSGTEDHCGDMDFKIAGTQRGVTGIQLDVKIPGLTRSVLGQVLDQARRGRLEVLRHMLAALRMPRPQISPYAPRLVQLSISTERIGNLIGPGGRNIRKIQEETKTSVEIDDLTGTVTVAGFAGSDMENAVRMVKGFTDEIEVGRIYTGKVVSIKEFGAFVEVLPGQEGLCHVSELAEGYTRSVDEVVRLGDEIQVKVLDIDPNGKVKLSKRAAERELANGGAAGGAGGGGGGEGYPPGEEYRPAPVGSPVSGLREGNGGPVDPSTGLGTGYGRPRPRGDRDRGDRDRGGDRGGRFRGRRGDRGGDRGHRGGRDRGGRDR